MYRRETFEEFLEHNPHLKPVVGSSLYEAHTVQNRAFVAYVDEQVGPRVGLLIAKLEELDARLLQLKPQTTDPTGCISGRSWDDPIRALPLVGVSI